MTGFPGYTTGRNARGMTLALRYPSLLLILALVLAPTCARAADKNAATALYDIALDMNHDGRVDRAAVVRDPASISAALYIYLGAGDRPLDLSHEPSFVKQNLTTDPVTGLAHNGKGALIVKYGRIGLGSNQYEMRLTIVYRRGAFWIAGFAKDWDMRDGSIGRCDINFLTGKGVAARGQAKPKPVGTKFKAIKLSDWSEESQPNACL
jgi:hypothetical protein